jgi:hypothetical protein
MRPITSQQSAETIALKGLTFLVNAPDSLDRFLALSGTSGVELRERAEEPEFLAAVVDFLLTDEPLLTAFCEAESLDAQAIHRARRMLPGA